MSTTSILTPGSAHRFSILHFIFLGALLMVCVLALASEQSESPEEQIIAEARAYEKAWNSGDIDTVEATHRSSHVQHVGVFVRLYKVINNDQRAGRENTLIDFTDHDQ